MDHDQLAEFIETVAGRLEELRAVRPGSPQRAPNGPHDPTRTTNAEAT
ncbi:hypothetical protein QNN03_23105 [Streptomyces sp. GXMU-J15]|uniref:Uncharacterized protein n=1 Tax=Streptomyces fuscus TaxID=3048495 RepID=A0ABT7J717_9ACTN|nr:MULTISPECIES: hypothetical protein [Streptomyces]MDL2079333.1 hypothetical protein [Streptomyces fuscus]